MVLEEKKIVLQDKKMLIKEFHFVVQARNEKEAKSLMSKDLYACLEVKKLREEW